MVAIDVIRGKARDKGYYANRKYAVARPAASGLLLSHIRYDPPDTPEYLWQSSA